MRIHRHSHRAVVLLSSLLSLVLLALAAAPARADGLRVLRSDETGLELEWTLDRPELVTIPGEGGPFRRPAVDGALYPAPAGLPDLPSVVEPVGVPTEGRPRVRVLSVTTGSMRVPDLAPAARETEITDERGTTAIALERPRGLAAFPDGAWPETWAGFEGTTSVRGQRIARLAIHPFRYAGGTGTLEWARRLVIRVEYGEGAGNLARGAAPDPVEDGFVTPRLLNGDVARRWKQPRRTFAARGTGDSFASSPNWVKFPIETEGIYRLDYFTFQNLGIDPAGVDPRTIRVFSGTNLQLEESYATPPPEFMTECALLDLGNGDDVFGLEDRFLLWALAPQGWASQYDPARSRSEHVEHWHTDQAWYWVTWGGSFAQPPRRMASRAVPPDAGVPDGQFATSAPHRVHFEENKVDDFRFRNEDGWMWEDLNGRGNDRRYDLDVTDPTTGDGFLQARLYSYQGSGGTYRDVVLKLQGQEITNWTWQHVSTNAQKDVTGCFTGLLANGANILRIDVETGFAQSTDQVETGWFDVEYERSLVADGGSTLSFVSMAAPPVLPTNFFVDRRNPANPETTIVECQPPASMTYGNSDWKLRSFDASGSDIHLFDVTDAHAPVLLTGWTASAGGAPHDLKFSETLTPGPGGIWYAGVTAAGVRALPQGVPVAIRDLRATSNGAEYLIIYHPSLEDGALRLAALRAASRDSLRTMAVSIDEVYDQFSWGLKDPVAIRDFLAEAFRSWGGQGGAPPFVALVGDAAYDTKRFLAGSPENILPTWSARYRIASTDYSGIGNWFYPTDDFFGYIEPEDYAFGAIPGLDVAIGRFPAATPEAFEIFLDKLEAYLGYEMPGQWQNRVILVADDERVLDPTQREPWHTQQVELLSRTRFPPAIDRVKIYLTEYPFNDFGRKPAAQAAFIDEFTRGALMTSYTGHGDPSTMAQEEVFVSQKIPELLNEDRYTVFSTFSCQISRYDLLSGDSMAELMFLHEGGGTVTTFASAGLVYPQDSSDLNQEWLSGIFGTPYLIPTYARTVRSIGEAGLLAKVIVADNSSTLTNNEKFVLLGDPALRVRFGRRLVQFEPTSVDSQLVDGVVRVVRGTVRDEGGNVMDGTNGQPPFRGTAWVHVTENADTSGYDYTNTLGTPLHIDYVLDGATAFRGLVPVTDGRFETRFHLPEGVLPGNKARISVFALTGDLDLDASGSYDSLRIAPTISPGQVDDTEGPSIVTRFEGYDNFVDGDFLFTDKPVLDIEITDPSGVNLRPFPQFSRLEADLDGRDRIDLTEDFTYVEGTFTQGKVRRILSLSPGAHQLRVKAFDNVGNRSERTVRFTIVLPDDEFDLVDRYVTAYPNPFAARTDFVFRLTHDAEVTLKIFTITGRKVWETEGSFFVTGSGGGPFGAEHRITWDGRDSNGGPLANGTYLYKVKAVRSDEEGDRQSDEYVGQVVRMR